MIKTNANDSKMTLDNSAIHLMRKESKDSWYRYTLEDEGSMTPVSANDEMPLTVLDTKTKFKTFRNVKTKTLLETANSVDQNNEDNDCYDPETANNPIPIKVQESNDIEK